jgi:anaerobic selenocysteine-containing dehydrogenase
MRTLNEASKKAKEEGVDNFLSRTGVTKDEIIEVAARFKTAYTHAGALIHMGFNLKTK